MLHENDHLLLQATPARPSASGCTRRAALAGRPPTMGPSRGTILVVDDDPDLRVLLGDVFTHAGYEVRLAADGRQALEQLKGAIAPGLVVLDLSMPVMDGWAFLAAQRQDPALSHIPVLVLTGEARVPCGVAGHLRKPVEMGRLLELVERCANRP